MDIPPKIVFNVTTLGASHIKDSKPCQDYSISWEDDSSGAAAIIVCDGHGSETCVRSDVGARLAAEISLNCIKQFISCSPEWILNKKGAVTAREQDADIRFETKAAKPVNDMTEIEAQRFRQRLTFIDQIKDLHDQDAIFEALFSSIHDKWIEAIELDSKEKPFSQEELSRLADNKLVKAYGTTLMAYIQTPLYWFAFHIGDGRILECDRHMSWKQAVPWDCTCFLNHTTSLCNSQPVTSFRYAFDATGNFPAAVFCCSDGLEDSWGDYDLAPEKLHNYCANLLRVFLEEGKVPIVEKLTDFLPLLSEKGSKDDMSLAGIINVNAAADEI